MRKFNINSHRKINENVAAASSGNMIQRVLLGAATMLLSCVAQAGTETQKLVNTLVIADSGTFVTVLAGGSSYQECGAFSLIAINKDANYDARVAMLLGAKLASTPVTITYANSGGSCTATHIQVGP